MQMLCGVQQLQCGMQQLRLEAPSLAASMGMPSVPGMPNPTFFGNTSYFSSTLSSLSSNKSCTMYGVSILLREQILHS